MSAPPSVKILTLSPLALLPRARHQGMHLEPVYCVAGRGPANAFVQPDGYLTEERKAAEPDQGFSTFFSETGMQTPGPSPGVFGITR